MPAPKLQPAPAQPTITAILILQLQPATPVEHQLTQLLADHLARFFRHPSTSTRRPVHRTLHALLQLQQHRAQLPPNAPPLANAAHFAKRTQRLQKIRGQAYCHFVEASQAACEAFLAARRALYKTNPIRPSHSE